MSTFDRNQLESYTEAFIHDTLIDYFSKYFTVHSEVRSDCSTKRIDLLLFHNLDTDKLYPIGIEIKKMQLKRGTDIGAWCLQANSYTKITFLNHSPLVFIFPQISGWYLDEGERVHKHNTEVKGSFSCQNNVNSFLFRSFNFGELQTYYCHRNIKRIRYVVNTYELWCSETPTKFNFINYLKCR